MDAQEFHHEAAPLTVAQLRTALEGVPDEARVRVFYAEEPGGSTAGEQVVISSAFEDQIWYPDARDYEKARTPGDTWFTIEAEFPTGDYLMREA